MFEQFLRTRRLTALVMVATVVLGACSSAASPTTPPASQPPAATQPPVATATPPAPSPSPAASPAASAGASVYEVAAVTTGNLAPYLTGEDGKTLYTLKSDSANKTTCTGGCATNWPPFSLDAGESTKPGTGVTGTLATFARPDGKMQVTYNGIPLYYFAHDAKAGETNGQGVGGVWFVAKP